MPRAVVDVDKPEMGHCGDRAVKGSDSEIQKPGGELTFSFPSTGNAPLVVSAIFLLCIANASSLVFLIAHDLIAHEMWNPSRSAKVTV